MADPADPAEEDEKSKSGGMLGLIILAVGCAVSSFATVYILTPSEPAAALACPPQGEHVATAPPLASADYVYQEVPEILVSIGSAPTTRYLKLKISVITDKKGANTVKDAEPLLLDAFTNYLRSVEVSDFEDPAFYPHLREQLGRRSELVLGHAATDGVLITEFLLR